MPDYTDILGKFARELTLATQHRKEANNLIQNGASEWASLEYTRAAACYADAAQAMQEAQMWHSVHNDPLAMQACITMKEACEVDQDRMNQLADEND